METAVLKSLFIGVLLIGLSSEVSLAQDYSGEESRSYSIYWKGVKTAEFNLVGPDSIQYSQADLVTDVWSDPATYAFTAPEVNPLFFVFPAAELLEASSIEWSRHDAMVWPDASTTYHKTQQFVNQKSGLIAHRWSADKASFPMDLLVTSKSEVVGAHFPTEDLLMIQDGYEEVSPLTHWLDPLVSAPDYSIDELRNIEFRTSDGVRLSTLVYLPLGDDAPQQFPTILIRTPYGITNLITQFRSYVKRGYAVVLQSTRGRTYWDPDNLSEGTWHPMIDEPADGAETIDWVASQPWSDGQICMEGGSYLGYTQWAAAMSNHPALKCLIPEVSMGTAFSDQPYRGGGFVQGLAYYVFWMLNKEILPNRNWNDILQHRPLRDIDVYATGEDIPQWNAFFDNWENAEYWQQQDWYQDTSEKSISTLQISGWFDDDLTGTQSNWDYINKVSSNPQALVLGPWKHGYNADRSLNGFDFGLQSVRSDIWLLKLKWYDRFLKDVNNGVDSLGVIYFTLGDNSWRTATSWPPENAVETSYYFHSDGEAARLINRGSLRKAPPEGEQPWDEYRYDPESPPKNWYSFELMESWADVQRFPYDFKDIESRGDVVTFTTPILTEDVSLAGTVEIELYASTDALDTDWYIHLSDVHPDNSSVRLTTGMLRARFRDIDDPIHQTAGANFDKSELLSGDISEVVKYRFTIPATANVFRQGHRIRVAVMNALDNYTFPNSNTGGDEGSVTESIVGTMRIHHSEQYPSRVILDILPSSH